jgi:hypothetical protein
MSMTSEGSDTLGGGGRRWYSCLNSRLYVCMYACMYAGIHTHAHSSKKRPRMKNCVFLEIFPSKSELYQLYHGS